MLRRGTSALFAPALCACLWASEADAKAAYGVVIGIDDYLNVTDLEGAVNDANDIAGALRRRDADVIVLTDEDATRSNVVGAMRAQLAKAVAGDVVIFTYAGHGVQLAEALIGDEADGQDESFALHGFANAGPGAAERLRDNDIAMILQEAPDGVSILFVADSCHSGTMTRAPVPGVDLGKTRFLELGPIEDDPLPPPDKASFQVGPETLSHVVFAAAARDHELTPEVIIDGQRRGALSWSMARAIEGAADGGDGETSLEDLRSFVRAEVRGWSGARQTPDVELGGAEAETLVSFLSPAQDAGRLGQSAVQEGGTLAAAEVAAQGSAQTAGSPEAEGEAQGETETETETVASSTPVAEEAPKPADTLTSATPPKLFIRGDATGAEATLATVATLVETEGEASLLWDTGSGQLIDRLSADMLAEAATAEAAAGAITKWRAVSGLSRWAPRRAFEFGLLEGDGLHAIGELVSLRISAPAVGPTAGHLTLFNLASGGEVQYLYPGPKTAAEGRDLLIRGQDARVIGPSKVSDPVGADHLIAVLTPVDAPGTALLREGLRGLNGTQNAEAALTLLAAHAADPRVARVGVLPLFTVRP
ncbi:MAG: caspase family protein [Pseudomonadota bacterium]